MGLFDSLRAKLKGVSKKLETEVEKSLGDQVERELAAAMAAKTAPAPPSVQPAPAPPTPSPRTPTPSTPGPAAPTPPAAPSQPSSRADPSPQPALPSAAKPTAPTVTPPAPTPAQVPQRPPSAPATSGDDPASTPQETAVPPASQPPSPGSRAPSAPTPAMGAPSAQSAAAAPAASLSSQPQQQQPRHVVADQKPRGPKQPQPQPTGRKMFTEAELAARLERELTEAVAVQKEVEAVVDAAPSARFSINEEVLEEILWDLEIILLEADVAMPVIEAIKASVKEQLLSMPVGGNPHDVVEKVLRTAIQRVLSVAPLDFDQFVRDRIKAGRKPVVIMFVGVNGTGKTTSIGRIAWRLKEKGISVCMAAGDTFRAGAIEQLALHGERLGVTVIQQKAGADPAAVAYDAIEHARARNKEVVLLDTAGRMQNNSNLMDEMDKIRRVANPDLCIFVGDSLAGNDAVEQARKFDEVVDVGGIILTKVDVDAKGGAALSVAYTIHKPLLFVGVGQNYPDLKPFDPKWMVDRLFGEEGKVAVES